METAVPVTILVGVLSTYISLGIDRSYQGKVAVAA